VITSRVQSYTGDAVFENIPTFTLQQFDQDKIRNFIHAWYQSQAEMGRVPERDRQERVSDLFNAVTSADLREISSNPMMLTSMAIIHQKEVVLSRERVRLYKLVVNLLITRWQKYKMGEGKLTPSKPLLDFLRDENRLLAALEHLAYKAQSVGKEKTRTAELSRMDALSILEAREYLGEVGLAAEFLDYIDQRSGLLRANNANLNKPSSYSFPHRTFQEYLAGCYLVRERNPAREYYQRAAESDIWVLAAQLGAEELYFNRRGEKATLDLAYQLLPPKKPRRRQDARAVLWSGMVALIAGTNQIVADADRPDGGEKYLTQLKRRLLALFETSLSPLERVEAGRILAKLGDPRKEVIDLNAMTFCFVPAGKFTMGEGDEQRTIDLPDYWIGKYLITNAQFNKFVEAGGYKQEALWTEAIKEGYWENGAFKGKYSNSELRDRARDLGEPYSLQNHPVVEITWYEALAFVHWLDLLFKQRAADMLRKARTGEEQAFWQGLSTDHLHISLPTEPEWEKAARGVDGRQFPWGNDANPNFANFRETGIGTTSAVGCFPGGRSVYGIEDLSGNVWEWVKGDNNLRGGSFGFAAWDARCASRFRFLPHFSHPSFGLRLVVTSQSEV
jgi:formylglycine-generating enzyme required for sulfatase activity